MKKCKQKFEEMSPVTLYKFKDQFEGEERERTIYDVLETAHYPDGTYGKYVNSPIISKFIWNLLGDHISRNERSNRDDINPSLFTSFRLDGHGFSKKLLPFLRRHGIIFDGYSDEFEDAMKLAQIYLSKSLPNVICSFSQSDEITVICGPSKIDKNGNRTTIPHNGRFQKYASIAASGAASRFTFALAQSKVHCGEFHELDMIPAIEFDCRIAQYDSFESAMQLVLWRAYDCSINGISSGVNFNHFHNKKTVQGFNSTKKLKFLHENNFLDGMTNHQLYGTFIWKKYLFSEEENQENETLDKVAKRPKVGLRVLSTQLLKFIKDAKSLELVDNSYFPYDAFDDVNIDDCITLS